MPKQEAEKDQQYPDRRGENKNDKVLDCRTFFTTAEHLSLSAFQSNYPFANEDKLVKMQRKIIHPPNPSFV